MMEERDALESVLECLDYYADHSNYERFVDPDYLWSGEEKIYDSRIDEDLGDYARYTLSICSKILQRLVEKL